MESSIASNFAVLAAAQPLQDADQLIGSVETFTSTAMDYVIGEVGILKELEQAGIQYLGGPVGVVSFDCYFNYYKIQTLCIRENPGCLFIAANRDAVTHLTDAQEWAGGGSMVGALCVSTQREPLIVGKPSTFMMDYLANKYGLQMISFFSDASRPDQLLSYMFGILILITNLLQSLEVDASPNTLLMAIAKLKIYGMFWQGL
ncbi:hypothetical protein RJ641_020900 [Dillenia turbinata]|uniref:Uncharacterized protein n=1 Tax=Dillenia turbinata TaxID=194707 RepID=A0AAN8Z016_9MAGN